MFLSFTIKAHGQERNASHDKGNLTEVRTHAKIIEATIEAISSIRNIEYLTEQKSTIPYALSIFHDPYISRAVVSINSSDTIQGAAFLFYTLEDSFRLKTAYDGKYLLYIDDSRNEMIADLSLDPYAASNSIGPLHMRLKTLLAQAIARNAEVAVEVHHDSIKIDIAFSLQIEFGPTGVREANDTIGFVSRYSVYVDPYTYLPLKLIRSMPYQTSIETILYQRVNFVDTLKISVTPAKYDSRAHGVLQSADTVLSGKLIGSQVIRKFMDVDGNPVNLAPGKKGLVVFTSIGWSQCEQAVEFLKQLRREFSYDDVVLCSIDPRISHKEFLRKYSGTHQINYPLIIADEDIKKVYPFSAIPVFMFIDRDCVIKKIIRGFNGKTTEHDVRNAIAELK